MKTLWLMPILLAGCSGGAGEGGKDSAAANKAAAAGIATLTGLYEGSGPGPANQMCIVPGTGDSQHFGLVVWGGNMHSCSGTGTATRDGATLRLAMAGDESCTLSATIAGNIVTLPAAVPDGCSYYCGARATLAKAAFVQKGTSVPDAAKAKDLVGESLCGEAG